MRPTLAINRSDTAVRRLAADHAGNIVPLFALANTGVYLGGGRLGEAIGSPIMLGIFLGYVLGKPIGILSASWVGELPQLRLRRTISWPVLGICGAVAGIASDDLVRGCRAKPCRLGVFLVEHCGLQRAVEFEPQPVLSSGRDLRHSRGPQDTGFSGEDDARRVWRPWYPSLLR